MPFNLFKKSPSHVQTAKRTKRADAEANEKRANSDHDILRRGKGLLDVTQDITVQQAKTREVEELAEELRKSEESHEKIKLENDQLVETMTKMKLDVEMLEKAKKEATAAAAGAETELAKIQRHNKSPGNPQSVSKLQQELAEARDANAKLENELQQQKLNWSAVEATMKRDLNEARLKCSAAQQDIINHEKTLGELRVERNQREARIGELEKEVTKSDAKWKECEVESNRTRQQLTEMTQKCAKLTEEISLLRSGRDELMTKIVTSSNDAERSKVDSLKKQLERLCSHIQESERMYSDTISVYRGHLLKAATGELSPQVAIALKEILKLHEEPQTSAPDPAPFAVVNHDHGD